MKKTYTVTGMTCDGCANTVKKLLSKVSGVKEATVSLNEKTAEITHDDVPLSALKIALRGFPYEIVERA
jgi:Cu2+-exporting ATPase